MNQQKPLLSVIMPCFNAERTLQSAIRSILSQTTSFPFEVIIVNDGSTDNSAALLENFRNDSRVKIVHNPKNLGGGAARNTGILNSYGKYILCFDCDNLLPKNVLEILVDYARLNKIDGVLYETSKTFYLHPVFHRNIHNKPQTPQRVQLNDLFRDDTGYLTKDNFLFTRSSFDKTNGYPVNHGFDTQGFGFLYIAKGFIVRVCPNSYYYHRQGMGKSYFEREYEAGKFSINTYLIFENMIEEFSLDIIFEILNFDIFLRSSFEGVNLHNAVGSKLLVEVLHSNMTINKQQLITSQTFIQAVKFYRSHNYKGCFYQYIKLFKRGYLSKVMIFNILRCLIGLQGHLPHERIEQVVLAILGSNALNTQISNVSLPLHKKVLRIIGLTTKGLFDRN